MENLQLFIEYCNICSTPLLKCPFTTITIYQAFTKCKYYAITLWALGIELEKIVLPMWPLISKTQKPNSNSQQAIVVASSFSSFVRTVAVCDATKLRALLGPPISRRSPQPICIRASASTNVNTNRTDRHNDPHDSHNNTEPHHYG